MITLSEPPQLWVWTVSKVECKLNFLSLALHQLKSESNGVLTLKLVYFTYCRAALWPACPLNCMAVAFPPFSKEEVVGIFPLFDIHSGFWHSIWVSCGPFSSDSFPCFKGMILILPHLSPCVWFRCSSLQLIISCQSIFFFQCTEGCIFSQVLVGRVFFSFWKAILSCFARNCWAFYG